MVFEKEFADYGYTDLVAYSGKDITEDMISACLFIEKKFYGEDKCLDAENVKEIILKTNQMCFVIVDKIKNAIVGYSFWLPLKTSVLNDFIKNKTTLLKFDEDYFTGFKEQNINLFLASEAFVLGYDIKKLHELLENIFSKRVLDLAFIGTKVKYIALESRSEFNSSYIVKKLGLSKSIKKDKSTFYFGEYNPKLSYKSDKYFDDIRQYYQKLSDKDN